MNSLILGILKPGVTMVHIEYEHDGSPDSAVRRKLQRGNSGSSMPAFTQLVPYGAIRKRLEAVGFEDAEVDNLSLNVLPMLCLVVVLAFAPYLIKRLLHHDTILSTPWLLSICIASVTIHDLYRFEHESRFQRDYASSVRLRATDPMAICTLDAK